MTNTPLHILAASLLRLTRAAPPPTYAPDNFAYCGFETRTPADHYHWDGLKRRGDPKHPYIIFQYTLAGQGAYQDRAGSHPQTPGCAFAALVPSEHQYFLPAISPSWQFFWLNINHPYAAQRMKTQIQSLGPTLKADPTSALITRAVAFLEAAYRRSFQDEFAREQALFEFLFEYQRFSQQQRYPQSSRERLLVLTRDFVLAHLSQPITVQQLAATHAMSRTYFSHHFAATTGLSPAQFVTRTRLEEAARRLLRTHDTLYAIAQSTGFADANHLCKVFRRHHHLSPGAFRKQMR